MKYMEPTRVSINMGVTINTGNFESIRLDLGVSDYVREGETVADADARVTKYVEKSLSEKMDKVKEELSRIG